MIIDTIRGNKLKHRKGLNQWDALLEEWLLAMERYSRINIDIGDAAYWHNERSNIGVLAGAAWRCGRIALEEFQQKKGYRNRQKKNGRCDLWIGTESDCEIVEAKYKDISMTFGDINGLVNTAMIQAAKDAKRTRGNDTKAKAIAVGFFPLCASVRKRNELEMLIETSLEKFFTFNYHALAWCFPKENRESEPKDGYLCPGIVMVVRNVKH